MTKKVDKDIDYMKSHWGTHYLASDYGWDKKQILSEIHLDDYKPKKHNFEAQNEIHARIRNDFDYDDWEYGTEPIYDLKKPE